MNYKKKIAFLFDICQYFIIFGILFITNNSSKTILQQLFGDGILSYFVYFILIRELYRLTGWRKYFAQDHKTENTI